MLTGLFNFPRFEEAKCSEKTAEFFFPESKKEWARNIDLLQSICGSCIHQADCLEYALENEIKHGFWGGKTEIERELLAPKQRKKERAETRNLTEYKRLQAQGWSIAAIAESSGVNQRSVLRTLDRAKKKGLSK